MDEFITLIGRIEPLIAGRKLDPALRLIAGGLRMNGLADGERAMLLIARFEAFALLGEEGPALASMREAVSVAPTSAGIRARAARVAFVDLGDSALAEEQAFSAIALDKNRWMPFHLGNQVLGRVALEHHDYSGAAQKLLRSMEIVGSRARYAFRWEDHLVEQMIQASAELDSCMTYLEIAIAWMDGHGRSCERLKRLRTMLTH